MYSTKLQILCTRWCAKEHRYTFGVRIRTLRMGTFYHLLLHFRPNSFFNVIDGVVHDHIKNSFVRKMHRWTFCKKKQQKNTNTRHRNSHSTFIIEVYARFTSVRNFPIFVNFSGRYLAHLFLCLSYFRIHSTSFYRIKRKQILALDFFFTHST